MTCELNKERHPFLFSTRQGLFVIAIPNQPRRHIYDISILRFFAQGERCGCASSTVCSPLYHHRAIQVKIVLTLRRHETRKRIERRSEQTWNEVNSECKNRNGQKHTPKT